MREAITKTTSTAICHGDINVLIPMLSPLLRQLPIRFADMFGDTIEGKDCDSIYSELTICLPDGNDAYEVVDLDEEEREEAACDGGSDKSQH